MPTADTDDLDDDREPDIRMNFSVSRDEFPVLTDAMLSIKKGRARKIRLATLATLGLLVETGKFAVNAVSGFSASPAPSAPISQEKVGYQPVLGASELADLLHEDQ